MLTFFNQLHRLLAQDNKNRALEFWEAHLPFDVISQNDRKKIAEEKLNSMKTLFPDLFKKRPIHDVNQAGKILFFKQ